MKPCPLCNNAVSELAVFPPNATFCGTCGRDCALVRQNPTLPPDGIPYSDLAGPAPTFNFSTTTAGAASAPQMTSPSIPTVPPAPPARPTVPPLPTPGPGASTAGYRPAPSVQTPPPPRTSNSYYPPASPTPQMQAPRATAWQNPQTMTVENTSGTKGPVPPEVANAGWNWGAFGANWIWLIGHNQVALGIVWVVLRLLFAAPSFYLYTLLADLGIFCYLGMNGNTLAWQSRRFKSIEEFKAVQKAWAPWGIGLMVLWVLGSLIILSGAHRM